MMESAAQAFRHGRRFLVTCHLGPDGDAIGSMLAVTHLLNMNGRVAVPFHPETIPVAYQFLPGLSDIVSDPKATRVAETFDTLVVVDVGERTRIAQKLPSSIDDALVVVIDHHRDHGNYGDIVWRRKSAAVGEMIVILARYLDWPVSVEFAECAYTAILTDTGSFRYSSTTAESLDIAAWLVDQGVQPWKVASHVYESWPRERVVLLGQVLDTLNLACKGQFASLIVSQSTIAACHASPEMTEGFVNYGRRIGGVEVAVLLRELGSRRYRISFRSRGRVDVGAIASQMNGGGHRNAAGATAKGELHHIRQRLVELVQDAIAVADIEAQDDFWSNS